MTMAISHLPDSSSALTEKNTDKQTKEHFEKHKALSIFTKKNISYNKKNRTLFWFALAYYFFKPRSEALGLTVLWFSCFRYFYSALIQKIYTA
jgi:hypothetical protein